MDIEKLKFPIGKFEKPTALTKDILNRWISDISTFPKQNWKTRLRREFQIMTGLVFFKLTILITKNLNLRTTELR